MVSDMDVCLRTRVCLGYLEMVVLEGRKEGRKEWCKGGSQSPKGNDSAHSGNTWNSTRHIPASGLVNRQLF